MRLWDRLIQRDYWEGQASGAAVFTTSYAGPDREPVMPQLAAWAQNANASSAVVFAAILIRMALFSEVRFQFQAKDDKHLFGNTSLAKLEEPWPNGSTGDLLARMEQDVSLVGNAYIWDAPGEDRLVRLRPDWVTIVSEVVQVAGGGQYRNKIGYWWEPPKTLMDDAKGIMYPADETVHWAPLPDPRADFRGMSWLTPVYRDIQGDDGLVQHKIRYLENAASPNMLIKYSQKLAPGTVDRIRERVTARYGGAANAYKTLILDQGADATVIGNSLQQMDFSGVSAVGAERILAAASVPGVLVGLEPLRGAGRGFQESMQKFANVWARPHWRSVCGAFEQIVDTPGGNRLWFDVEDIAALQDGEMERGQAALVRAQALLALVQAGYTHESAIAAVDAMDLSQLKAGGIGTPTSGPQVQHQLPQTQPGATADPLPPTLGRLPVGPTSPGGGGDGSRPTPRPASARRALDAPPDDDEWEDGDDLDLDELLADAETPTGDVARFDPYHAKAGSPTGGQFSSASGGSGPAKANGAKTHHGATATLTTSGHAQQKHELQQRAAADRAEAHHLQAELAALLKQMRASVAAHKKAAASAKAAAAGAKTATHHKTAVHHHRTARHHHRHARSLHSRITALRGRIHALLAQAKHLDAQAAKL